jgi:hypothetical protein
MLWHLSQKWSDAQRSPLSERPLPLGSRTHLSRLDLRYSFARLCARTFPVGLIAREASSWIDLLRPRLLCFFGRQTNGFGRGDGRKSPATFPADIHRRPSVPPYSHYRRDDRSEFRLPGQDRGILGITNQMAEDNRVTWFLADTYCQRRRCL